MIGLACGEAPAPEATDTEDSISARTAAFVTLTRDQRRCVSPLCGGYFTTDVNTTRVTQYVSALDFSQSNLDPAVVMETPLEDLVIYGVLGPREPRFDTRTLIVHEAYRGLPGITRGASDGFFAVIVNNPPIQCFAAPCNNARAQLINRNTAPSSFTTLDVQGALAPLVDPAYLVARVERDGALVAGRLVNGALLQGGRERVLRASQVYLRLPVDSAPCPLPPIAQCPEPFVNVFGRTGDRCVMPAGCVEAGVCTLGVPSCQDGYTLSSFTAGPFACPAYVCDPTFTLAPEQPVERWTEEAIDARSAAPYRNNQRLAWLVTSEVPGTTKIRLHFASFSLEDGYDFVTVSDTSGLQLARYSGKLGEFVTDEFPVSAVRVVFTSDGSVTDTGFVLDRIDAATF